VAPADLSQASAAKRPALGPPRVAPALRQVRIASHARHGLNRCEQVLEQLFALPPQTMADLVIKSLSNMAPLPPGPHTVSPLFAELLTRFRAGGAGAARAGAPATLATTAAAAAPEPAVPAAPGASHKSSERAHRLTHGCACSGAAG
jgi:hypothetical protein